MRYLVATILTLLGAPLAADPLADWQADRTVPLSAEGLERDSFTWIARPVVVFADSPHDPRLTEQLELLAARAEDLAERDVVVIVDSDPSARSPWREALRPRGFMLVVIAKDGGVAARRPTPRDGREITRQIDKMPLRQQEVAGARAGR